MNLIMTPQKKNTPENTGLNIFKKCKLGNMIHKNHIYILLCSCSILLSITALILNIKTVPLIKKQHIINKKIKILSEKNQQLNYKIQKESTYQKIEEKAKNLNMIYLPPNKTKHYYLPKKIASHEK